MSHSSGLCWAPSNLYNQLQVSKAALPQQGRLLGDRSDLGPMSLLNKSRLVHVVEAVFRERERERDNISPAETLAQNQHIITLLCSIGLSKSHKPNPDSRGGNGLHLLMGRDTKSPRKEGNGSQFCKQSSKSLPHKVVVRIHE